MNILITSADYINSEMAAEFGDLPPAFLPLGTERLIQHQVRSLDKKANLIFLSLPESFVVLEPDREMLKAIGVRVIPVPEGISLGKSIRYCLARIRETEPDSMPLTVMHGDTMIDLGGLAPQGNSCIVAPANQRYQWGYAFTEGSRFVGASANTEEGSDAVLVGYFTFRSALELERALAHSNDDFLTALSRLAIEHDVTAIHCKSWSDFGHLLTYYQSRASYASARSFNELNISNGLVRKTSKYGNKIQAEAEWFAMLPPKLQPYSARLIEAGENAEGHSYYSTEYEYLPSLQELFVFGRLSPDAWRGVLHACCDCLEGFSTVEIPDAPPNSLQLLAQNKTRKRIDQFEQQSGLDLGQKAHLGGRPLPSPRQIAEEMIAVVATASPRPATIMHGDFCFSNILFNSRTNRVRLLDPRGTLDGMHPTNSGDSRYDMAKLAHSVIGLYDLIIAGRVQATHLGNMNFDLILPDQSQEYLAMSRWFLSLKISGTAFGEDVVTASMILLFLSMLPLHADRPDRQLCFLANALRLYENFFGNER